MGELLANVAGGAADHLDEAHVVLDATLCGQLLAGHDQVAGVQQTTTKDALLEEITHPASLVEVLRDIRGSAGPTAPRVDDASV